MEVQCLGLLFLDGLSDGNVGFRSTLLHKDSARSMERFAKLNHHYIAGDIGCRVVVVTVLSVGFVRPTHSAASSFQHVDGELWIR